MITELHASMAVVVTASALVAGVKLVAPSVLGKKRAVATIPNPRSTTRLVPCRRPSTRNL